MKELKIKNKFHGAEHTFKISDENFREVEQGNEHVAFVKLSESQVKRADKALCGMGDCACGGIHAAGEQTNSAGTEWIFPIIED